MQNYSCRILILVTLALLLQLGCGSSAKRDADARRLDRVLVFSKTSWYRHEDIPAINHYFVTLGAAQGFMVDVSEDAGVFTAEGLKPYQAVIFNNTTDIGKSLDDAQKSAFADWFRSGGGYVGIHAAAVHHHTWPWYEQMLGGNFNSDTERQEGRVLVDPSAREHPAVQGWPKEIVIAEEWNNFESSVRGQPETTVLLTLDEASLPDKTVKVYFQDKGGRLMGADHPIAWARQFEGGRVFYTTFGHDLRPLEHDLVKRHILQGLRWSAGTE